MTQEDLTKSLQYLSTGLLAVAILYPPIATLLVGFVLIIIGMIMFNEWE